MVGFVDETLLMHGGRETLSGRDQNFHRADDAFICWRPSSPRKRRPGLTNPSEFRSSRSRQQPAILELVQRYVFMETAWSSGVDWAYANAYELALKLMEAATWWRSVFRRQTFCMGRWQWWSVHFP